MAKPFAPRRPRRQRGERGNLRQRDVAQMLEVENLTIDRRRAYVVVLEFGAPESQLGVKPAQTPFPALAIADNRGVDQQPLPSPGRAQSAFDHRHWIGHVGTRWRGGRRRLKLRGRRAARRFEVRRDEARRFVAIRIRHLGERKILRVAARREMLGRASQQREQGAATGLGASRAARKAGRNRGPGERLFEIRHVTSRRVQSDCHPVERDASGRLGKNPARNFDALLHLARRRDDFDRIVELALGRGLVAEQVILKPRDRSRARGCAGRGRRCHAKRRGEHRERGRVAFGHCCEYRGRARGERRVQFALERRADRDIEHQDRHRGVARRRIGLDDSGRQREHARAVDQVRVAKLGLELAQHRGERRADFFQRRQLRRADSRQPNLAQRAGERARKSRTVGNRGEIAQRAGLGQFVNRSRGHRLGAQTGGRHQAVAKQPLGAEHAQ